MNLPASLKKQEKGKIKDNNKNNKKISDAFKCTKEI